MRHVKRVLNINCLQKEDKTISFFQLALNNVKNLLLSNGSEHLRIAIQRYQNSFFFQKITALPPDSQSLRRLGAPLPNSRL